MEGKVNEKKIQPKRKKVVKADKIKKKGKRSSRKDKKQDKNFEKKTRSGCTYSPYEVLIEKSERNKNLSDLQSSQTEMSSSSEPVKVISRLSLAAGDSDLNSMKENIELKQSNNTITSETNQIQIEPSSENKTKMGKKKEFKNDKNLKSTKLVAAKKKDDSNEVTNDKVQSIQSKSSLLTSESTISKNLKFNAEEALRKIKRIIEIKEQTDGNVHDAIAKLWAQKLKGLPDPLQLRNGKKRGRKPSQIKIKHSETETKSKRTYSLDQEERRVSSGGKTKSGEFMNSCLIDNKSLEGNIDVTVEESSIETEIQLVNEYENFQVKGCDFKKTTVNIIQDEINEEQWDLNSFTNSKLLDLVFPDSELCYTIREEDYGSCAEFGCSSIKIFDDYKQEERKNIKIRECASNCMFTDTDKYKFKSCFKNIHSQIENFDRYRGAETPGGEASLYDVNETSPLDTRKLYRKNFSDLKLNLWYNYVYHSAQLARIGGNTLSKYGTTNNSLPLDMPVEEIFLTPISVAPKIIAILTRGRLGRYPPGEYIWKCNYFMDIPSVDDVLPDTSISDTSYAKYHRFEGKKTI